MNLLPSAGFGHNHVCQECGTPGFKQEDTRTEAR